METFVLLLIMVAISLFNWLIKRAAEAKEAREQAEREGQDTGSIPSGPRPSRQATPPVAKRSEEERLREFMEALGIPKEKLPRQLRREQRPPAPQQPERKPVQAAPPPLRREASKPRKKPKPSPVVTQPAAVVPSAIPTRPPVPDVQEISETLAPDAYKIRTAAERAATSPAVTLHEVLVSKNGFRNAFLMHEIIGQPRSLRPHSDLPGLA